MLGAPRQRGLQFRHLRSLLERACTLCCLLPVLQSLVELPPKEPRLTTPCNATPTAALSAAGQRGEHAAPGPRLLGAQAGQRGAQAAAGGAATRGLSACPRRLPACLGSPGRGALPSRPPNECCRDAKRPMVFGPRRCRRCPWRRWSSSCRIQQRPHSTRPLCASSWVSAPPSRRPARLCCWVSLQPCGMPLRCRPVVDGGRRGRGGGRAGATGGSAAGCGGAGNAQRAHGGARGAGRAGQGRRGGTSGPAGGPHARSAACRPRAQCTATRASAACFLIVLGGKGGADLQSAWRPLPAAARCQLSRQFTG